VKTVADRYIHAAHHNKHWWQAFWIYQHRWPWTTLNPSKRGFWWIFCNFRMQRTFQHWIATKWLEIDRDNLHMEFSAFNVDFSSSSSDPLGSRRPVQAGVKDSYPLKSGYFTAIISCRVNTVADRHRHAAYHNKHWWQAF